MAMSDHLTRISKLRARVVSVDPANRVIDVIGADNGARRIIVWEIPSGFRWPKENEDWSIYEENGNWYLGSRANNVTDDFPIDGMQPGDMRLDSEFIYDGVGNRIDPVEIDTHLGALDSRVTIVEAATLSGTWQRVGVGGVTFGAKFADLTTAYTCWWRKDGLGVMHFRGLAGCISAASANDPVLLLAPGKRMGVGGVGLVGAVEEGFAVAMNATASAEKAGMVMFETTGTVSIVCREAISVGGWIGLASISYLAEA